VGHCRPLLDRLVSKHWEVQSIALGVSFNFNPLCRSHGSLFNGTWQKRPGERDHRLRFETEEMTLQTPKAVASTLAQTRGENYKHSIREIKTALNPQHPTPKQENKKTRDQKYVKLQSNIFLRKRQNECVCVRECVCD